MTANDNINTKRKRNCRGGIYSFCMKEVIIYCTYKIDLDVCKEKNKDRDGKEIHCIVELGAAKVPSLPC